MKPLTIQELAKITGGKIIGNNHQIAKTFCTDTRKIKPNDVYLGLKGETFNGSDFWKQALEAGASTVIIETQTITPEERQTYLKQTILLVDDTKQALHQIASYRRDQFGQQFPLVGVTGSVGKTSTKDMIANVLSQKYKTLKTEGNFNNDIGLPLTLLNLQDHEAAVIEMGMNHLGEISTLSKIAKPSLSVITNIGTSHIGNLGSRKNILKAKLEILEGMEKPFLFINQDNDLLSKWNQTNQEKLKTITYGIDHKADIMAKNINLHEDHTTFICQTKQESFSIDVPVPGIPFVINSLCAIAVALSLGLTKEQIQQGIKTFSLTAKRMEVIELANGIKIINDAYNASYESMQTALVNLAHYEGKRKIAVLGDMFELGEFAPELHRKVGKEVVKNKIDQLICTGENSQYIVNEAKKQGMNPEQITLATSREEILTTLIETTKDQDIILFKASNGMKFYTIVNEYLERKNSQLENKEKKLKNKF